MLGEVPGRCCFLRFPAAKHFWGFAEMQAAKDALGVGLPEGQLDNGVR